LHLTRLKMTLTLESQPGFLEARLTGRLSFDEAVQAIKRTYDAAEERGLKKILLDCVALEGELSVLERYELGTAAAAHYLGGSQNPAVALIGVAPAVNGFAANVAWNRGVNVRAFTDRGPGLQWLRPPAEGSR
jgi:hypothetical protein